MRCVALIIAECKCIGTLEGALLRRSNKERIGQSMVHILSRIWPTIWSQNMAADSAKAIPV